MPQCIPEINQQATAASEDASAEAVFAAARRYVAAGLSVIPIASDLSKSPDGRLLPRLWDPHAGLWRPTWKPYQCRRPTEPELQAWYDQGGRFDGGAPGIAVVTGAVSGGLEAIDFDDADLFGPWSQLVDERRPGLWQTLVRVRTPRPGLHVYYRCRMWGPSQKLACGPAGAEVVPVTNGATSPPPGPRTLIETKGEGGYCLVPPSPRFCHPSQEPYRLAPGSPPLEQVPTVAEADRAVLLQAARLLNQWPEPDMDLAPSPGVRREAGAGDRPGDDFNRRATWTEILGRHGWVQAGGSGGVGHWRRPGKAEGISATTNYAGSGLLYAFSTNAAPFTADRAYTKFAAYALLEHGGDYAAAARALRQRGYGQGPGGGGPPSPAAGSGGAGG